MVIFNGSEGEMFSFFEMTPDLVCIAGKDGYFKNFNPAVIQKLGYSVEELFSLPITTFIHPDDRAQTEKRRDELLNGKALMNFYNRYITKTGEVLWLHWTSIYVPDKEVVFAIAKDVTVRKQHEREIIDNYRKFKSLATHFKKRLEKDKEFLAMELHEELAQLAAVIKMDIDWVSNHLANASEEISSRIEHALSVSDFLVDSIRKISYSISPHMIRDVGLADTLQWLCGEFSIRNGITCEFNCKADTENISHEIQLDIFRFCQECLSNVANHAQAGSVKIVVETIDDSFCISIIDNGKGFDVSKLVNSQGLTGMQKRAASVNGKVTVKSIPGKGTTICFIISMLHAMGNVGKAVQG